jgi:hypothetical protein
MLAPLVKLYRLNRHYLEGYNILFCYLRLTVFIMLVLELLQWFTEVRKQEGKKIKNKKGNMVTVHCTLLCRTKCGQGKFFFKNHCSKHIIYKIKHFRMYVKPVLIVYRNICYLLLAYIC